MDYAVNIITFIQFFFAIVIGLYFLNLLKSQQGNKVAIDRESRKEMDKLQRLREISLTEPLAEKTRPSTFAEIIGQEEGLKALRAALCGTNPQHVLIYGPPGVGKTAAARLVLEEAKRHPLSPFAASAKFIEMDATTARFDERGIADPLIGTVHDPIYQGAGPLGVAGIPQPKPGAVTKAHGGILFIDEIGELHNIQMNKLLKVLEDRKVFLESSYYSSEDTNIPNHIHDIFQNGLPADFRLVGATTRTAQEIPPAIRSRCVEIFFRQLLPDEISIIARNAAKKIDFVIDDKAVEVVKGYATNGRDAVNIIQIAAGIAVNERGKSVIADDVEWVVNFSQYSPRPDKKIPANPQIGFVNGLAVYGANIGTMMEIEVSAVPNPFKNGKLKVTGVVDEEEIGSPGRLIRRKSMAKGSVENVLTVLANRFAIDFDQYDVHVNFPGGGPIDGPSAGITMAVAIFSAIKNIAVDNKIAMTGEISIRGLIKPVGGVSAKVTAAKQAGVKKVLIPKENWQQIYQNCGIEVIAIETIDEAIAHALIEDVKFKSLESVVTQPDLLTATGVGIHMAGGRQ
ncbi:ATP-dependent protease LonB|uniref:endopeptidase La n=1 Tax=Dendrosporobacter quercicolus TaxID=146817 RepID=A0A1G9N6X1_9FIRM|nr:ATP-dependent protease LonB [Dendrosporobacter quercicolus]NSL47245.1 ATP-dependent protease LonB [Dendrosporobacter quercicolus DSM 1736]SDL82041.1 Lon-like ATP-dependent protease [Dendrosporobacter quercicolus]